jgi:hypothetical protein
VTHTVQEVKDHVSRQFGDDSGSQILDADFYRWVNEGQLEIYRRTESSIQAPPALNSVVGQSEYTLPTGFLKAISVAFNGRILAKTSRKLLDLKYPQRSAQPNSTPQFWAVDTGELLLFPPPDTVAAITLEWHGRPTPVDALADTLEVSDTYFTTLCRFCLAMAFQLDGDLGSYNTLMGEVNARLGLDYHDAKDPYDDYYPFVTYISEE